MEVPTKGLTEFNWLIRNFKNYIEKLLIDWDYEKETSLSSIIDFILHGIEDGIQYDLDVIILLLLFINFSGEFNIKHLKAGKIFKQNLLGLVLEY